MELSQAVSQGDHIANKPIPFLDSLRCISGYKLDGKLHGQIQYFEDLKSRQLYKTAEFKNGVLDGNAIFYSPARDDNGNQIYIKERLTHYSNGIPLKDVLYSSGKIFEESQYNIYGDNHGQFIRYHSNEGINFFGIYENGAKEGEWQFYRFDGGVEKIINYSKDVKHGFYQEFDKDERKLLYEEYNNGKLHGNVTKYSYTSGDIIEKSFTYKDGLINGPYEERFNGLPIIKGEYLNGSKEGEWKFYDDSKLTSKISFRSGEFHGQAVEYKDDCKWEGEYVSGQKDGEWRRFVSSMKYSDRIDIYKNGVAKNYILFDADQNIIEKGFLSNGKPHGPAIKYTNGKGIPVIYKNGSLEQVLSPYESNAQIELLKNQTNRKL